VEVLAELEFESRQTGLIVESLYGCNPSNKLVR
jgi:hypothetical protein